MDRQLLWLIAAILAAICLPLRIWLVVEAESKGDIVWHVVVLIANIALVVYCFIQVGLGIT